MQSACISGRCYEKITNGTHWPIVCLIASHRRNQLTRVARFGLFEATKKQIWPFFKLVGFEICENLSISWPLFKSIEVYIVKSKIFSFPKTEFAIFQLQAPGNPDQFYKGVNNTEYIICERLSTGRHILLHIDSNRRRIYHLVQFL